LPLLADMSEPEEVNSVVRLGLERFGKVDVLVCVAGIRPHKPFFEYGYDEWIKVFAVNVHSTFYLAKAVAPGMMQRRSGSIIALGSVASITSVIDMAVEVAAKHSLYGLVKSLALELGPYGVRANLLALSYIANDRQYPEWYPATGGRHTSEQIDSTALKRPGTRQEVANAALFLASDQSSYVTGDRILCAGGRYM
jgi:NAD(P)-dependent dehydrogenase (short-subunit alcohol dehydrogenase family)